MTKIIRTSIYIAASILLYQSTQCMESYPTAAQQEDVNMEDVEIRTPTRNRYSPYDIPTRAPNGTFRCTFHGCGCLLHSKETFVHHCKKHTEELRAMAEYMVIRQVTKDMQALQLNNSTNF